MRELSFESIEEFCEEFTEISMELESSENFAEIVANYDEAKTIIAELIYYGYELYSIELIDPSFDSYNGEFSICVIDGKIFCEKIRKDNGEYRSSSASIVYFIDDVNQKSVKAYKEAVFKYIVEIDDKNDEDYPECDGNCDECELNDEITLSSGDSDVKIDEDEDGIHGFTVSKSDGDSCSSYSFYSSDSIDGMTLKHLFKIFDS